MQISESNSYQISTKYVQEFMGWMEKSIYDCMESKLCYESVQLKFVYSW
jgi:hypothetical protein